MELLWRGLVVVALLAGGCAARDGELAAKSRPALECFQYCQLHMGVPVRLVLFAPDAGTAEMAATAAFARVSQLDQIASDYRASSELMRLCARAGSGPVPVSEDLFKLIEKSCEVSRWSDGAFDITVGPHVALWRKARKAKQLPDAGELSKAAALVGWEKIMLDPAKRTVELAHAGMKLDLGGIAKGYAGDCAIAVLRAHGIRSAMFEAGGDIVLSDAPPGHEGWEIEVIGTHAEAPGGDKLKLANCAVSTSGDTEQFVVIDGRRYSHVVDPQTGIGLTQRAMATIIAPDGITSDALSTACAVLGETKSCEMLKHYPKAKARIRTIVD